MLRIVACLLLYGCAHTLSAADLAPSSLGPEPMMMGAGYGYGYAPEHYAQPPFVRDTSYGARPNGGQPCSPTEGYQHYDLPSKHYGVWYRPSAAAEDTMPRCKSRPFAPRGFGWANRKSGCQIDYHPYVVKQLPSPLGPSYYYRQPLVPCHCWLQGHHQGIDGQH